MLLTETVMMKWNSKNKKRFVDLGYKYTKMRDEFEIKVSDLSDGSNVTVEVQCDYCGKIYTKHWDHYIHENRDCYVHKDCCCDCKVLKTREIAMMKYGVDNVFYLDEIKEKIAQTNLKKYGAENPFASESIKTKIKETLIEKYGVDSIYKVEEINEKRKRTNLERYGYEYTIQNPDVKRKANETAMKRYGVESVGKIPKNKGSKNPLWKGGVEYHKQLRQTDEYRKWRYSVFKRDGYVCQCCGNDTIKDAKGKLIVNAHHIKNFADNEDLRYDVDNGITLCVNCHREFHSAYGNNNTTQEQLDLFILNHGKKIC